MEKAIRKHKPSECPFRGKDNGVFGCTTCMPKNNMEEKNLQVEQFNKIRSDSMLIVNDVKDLIINGIDDKRGYEAVRASIKRKMVKRICLRRDTTLICI